jgi:hypothetical protein
MHRLIPFLVGNNRPRVDIAQAFLVILRKFIRMLCQTTKAAEDLSTISHHRDGDKLRVS